MVKWWRGSDSFEDLFWIVSGGQLSRRTLAFGLQDGTERTAGPEEVDIDSWSERSSDAYGGTLYEESRYLAKYTQVMTLLQYR